MAKVSKKSEKITAFGGIFFVLDKFDSILFSVIDSHLGLRSRLIGYQQMSGDRCQGTVPWHPSRFSSASFMPITWIVIFSPIASISSDASSNDM